MGGGFEPLHGAMAVDAFILLVRDLNLESLLSDCISPWAVHIKLFGPNDGIVSFGQQWDGVDAALVRPDARVVWVCRDSFPREHIQSSIRKLLGNICREV